MWWCKNGATQNEDKSVEIRSGLPLVRCPARVRSRGCNSVAASACE